MAEDSRDPATAHPKTPQIAEAQIKRAPIKDGQATPPVIRPPTNEYSRTPPATITDAAKTISIEDFKKVHLQPCVRNALLYGIGAGFAFGGTKLVLRAPVPTAANWAAGTFAGASAVTYEFCQYRRHRERAGLQKVVEIIDRKKARKEREMEEKREELRKAKEKAAAEEAARLEASKPWYKKIF